MSPPTPSPSIDRPQQFLPMPTPFPFSAIVGQDEMKQAILVAAVDPGVGGVLVFGDRGTGKSTAVRALAALLPPMRVTEGCRYGCDPAPTARRANLATTAASDASSPAPARRHRFASGCRGPAPLCPPRRRRKPRRRRTAHDGVVGPAAAGRGATAPAGATASAARPARHDGGAGAVRTGSAPRSGIDAGLLPALRHLAPEEDSDGVRQAMAAAARAAIATSTA